MDNVTQELWDKYKELITSVENYLSGTEINKETTELCNQITDNRDSAELRNKLYKSGIKL